VTYSDKYDIGSVSLPGELTEMLDTISFPTFKLVMVNITATSNDDNAFGYSLIFPTALSQFDMFQLKKDSSRLNTIFESMINGVEANFKGETVAKNYFNYPEPGVRTALQIKLTNQIVICRVIVFDDYIISTNAVGNDEQILTAKEDVFFKTLKVNPEKRNRKF